jgi:aspartate ammonia-lyase
MCDQFVTDFIQGGAGTSTNMNANEVIANLALEQLSATKGEYQYVNPNDHVNYGQSTNDVYPTAFRLALILRLASYMDALRKLQDAFYTKAREFDRVLKMGRTHLQDAVPMSLGQEFHGWGTTIGEEVQPHRRSAPVAARDQPGGHRHRHHGDRRAGLPGTGTGHTCPN